MIAAEAATLAIKAAAASSPFKSMRFSPALVYSSWPPTAFLFRRFKDPVAGILAIPSIKSCIYL
jgi:hypothetical protein